VREFLEQFLAELRVAMQLTGAASVAAMQQRPVVVTGQTREWLAARGFEGELHTLARRGMPDLSPDAHL
jgi:isopentenyl-diphosphate delta-isomerase